MRFLEVRTAWRSELADYWLGNGRPGISYSPGESNAGLEFLTDLEGLERLGLYGVGFAGEAQALSACTALRRLTILTESQAPLDLSDLEALEWLEVDGRPELTLPPPVRQLKIDTPRGPGVVGLGGLRHLEKLTLVDAYRVHSLEDLHEVGSSLESLRVGKARKLEDISGLVGMGRLREVELQGCSALGDLSALARCKHLETLTMSGAKSL